VSSDTATTALSDFIINPATPITTLLNVFDSANKALKE
jgi:hypothetical protein